MTADELVESLVSLLGELPETERVDHIYKILEAYCRFCGSNEGYRCVCMKDE